MSSVKNNLTIRTCSAEETKNFGSKLAGSLKPGDVVCLFGDLGSGKTCLIQGICQGWGVAEPVVSPTFTLINEYNGKSPVYHFDLYRLRSSAELINIGFQDYVYGGELVLIEWPEKAGKDLPIDRLDIIITIVSREERVFQIAPSGEYTLELSGLC